MMLANNGILIVALTMALGLFWRDSWLIAAALGMAGLSYLVNLMDAFEIEFGRLPMFAITVCVGVAAYVVAFARLMGI